MEFTISTVGSTRLKFNILYLNLLLEPIRKFTTSAIERPRLKAIFRKFTATGAHTYLDTQDSIAIMTGRIRSFGLYGSISPTAEHGIKITHLGNYAAVRRVRYISDASSEAAMTYD